MVYRLTIAAFSSGRWPEFSYVIRSQLCEGKLRAFQRSKARASRYACIRWASFGVMYDEPCRCERQPHTTKEQSLDVKPTVWLARSPLCLGCAGGIQLEPMPSKKIWSEAPSNDLLVWIKSTRRETGDRALATGSNTCGDGFGAVRLKVILISLVRLTNISRWDRKQACTKAQWHAQGSAIMYAPLPVLLAK